MARGTSFGELITQLRTEARMDPNPALSKNVLPLMKQLLKRHYERLYDDFDWPFLKVMADKDTAAGERYYDVPDNMNLERISKVDFLYGGRWLPVDRGIDLTDYGIHDSDNDVRADPVMKWDVIDAGSGSQIELWPIPVVASTVRFRGFRKKVELVADADLCDLDDQLVVLYAASELLASSKDGVAQVKLAAAKKRLDTLTGRLTKNRAKGFVLGGVDPSMQSSQRRREPLVAYVRDA